MRLFIDATKTADVVYRRRGYCGNQRSIKSAQAGLVEADYLDLLNFENSPRYDERQKSALAYTEAITWDLPADDGLWARLHAHFNEAELVELGYFVAITMGQQRWLRTLNIEHHQVLAGTGASMAPGFETAEDFAKNLDLDRSEGPGQGSRPAAVAVARRGRSSAFIGGLLASFVTRARQRIVEFAADQLFDERACPNADLGLDRIEPAVEKINSHLGCRL